MHSSGEPNNQQKSPGGLDMQVNTPYYLMMAEFLSLVEDAQRKRQEAGALLRQARRQARDERRHPERDRRGVLGRVLRGPRR